MEYSGSTIFITGVSKPGKDDPITSVYQVFFLSLIVDKENDTIVDAACNTASNMTEAFIRSMFIGRSIAGGVEEMAQDIRRRFFGLAQKALIVALKDAHNRYIMVKKNKMCEDDCRMF